MAEITENKRPQRKARAKRSTIRLDMTPMVDLAFLLLSFFILTTTLAKETSLDLVMPFEGPTDPRPVNNAITLILSKSDKIYYYEGELKEETVLKKTDFGQIESLLREKNKPLMEELDKYRQQSAGQNVDDSMQQAGQKALYEKHGINVVIKYDSLAKYRNTVDIIDEMDACSVPAGKYAIVKKLAPAEKKMLRAEYGK